MDMVSQYNMENPSRPFKTPTTRQIKYHKSLFLKNAKDKSLEEISPTPTLLINNSVITNNDFLLNATGSKIVESHQYQAADKDERIDLLIQENEKLHSTVNLLSEAIDDKDQELKNVIMEAMEADEALMEAGEDSKIHDNCNRNLIRRLKYAHKVEMDKVKYTPEASAAFSTLANAPSELFDMPDCDKNSSISVILHYFEALCEHYATKGSAVHQFLSESMRLQLKNMENIDSNGKGLYIIIFFV